MPSQPPLTINDLSPELRRASLEAKCLDDFPWWLYEYGIVEMRELGVRPFKEQMWPFQWDFADFMANENRLIVLKARQTGISTITMHYIYNQVRFKPPHSQHVLVLSKSKEDAAYLLEKIPRIHQNMISVSPELAMPIEADNTFSFELENGNKIECLAATKAGGRSRAATIVVLDEFAFHQYAKENFAALKPTLEGGGKVFLISTGNGTGNEYHKQWQLAKQQASNFRAIFIPFDVVPHRTDEWYKHEEKDYIGHEELFFQEYPRNDSEAFTKTGSSPFDQEYVQEQIRLSEQLGRERPPTILYDGRGKVWEKPKTRGQYVAGLDMAQGIGESGNPDATSLKIVDLYGKLVATWDGRLELTEAAPEIAQMLLEYNPFLCVERNAAGAGFIPYLQAQGFKNYYRFDERHFMPDAERKKDLKIGLTLTPKTKTIIIGNLITWINTRSLQAEDPEFWREVSTFVQTGPTRWGGLAGYKDDRVLAMAHALWARSWFPLHRKKKRSRRIKWH